MKAYILNDGDFNKLQNLMEITKLRAQEMLGTHDPQKHLNDDMFRNIWLHVYGWIEEVKK